MIFNLNSTYTLTFAGSVTNANASVRGGDATLALGTNRYEVSGNLSVAPIAGDVATLRIAGNSTAVKTSSLTIGSSGKLDLTTANLVVDYTGPSVADTIRGYLAAGRNGGSWDGPGIDSSSVGNSTFHALGYAETSQSLGLSGSATALWNGQTVDATSVLVKYTYGGDANLDGKIDVDDYGRIDFNVNFAGVSGWFNGDFNYDGKVNVDDYGIIDFNVGIQGAPFPTGAGIPGGLSGVSAVPEPATLSVLALAATTTLLPRRRRPR